MDFPVTASDYATLVKSGQGVEYAETANSTTPPDNTGTWTYWSDLSNNNGTVSVWRRIVPLSEIPTPTTTF